MRSLTKLLVLLLAAASLVRGAAPAFSFQVIGDEPGPWEPIFSSIGMTSAGTGLAHVFVVRSGSNTGNAAWPEKIEHGAILILEGESDLASSLGFQAGHRRIAVRNVIDGHVPKLPIIWEKTLDLPIFTLPPNATVFARERWEGAPLMAGFRKGSGAVLWLAVTPGAQGYERFPYLLQALSDLGFEAPFRSARLWAFFDSAYRTRVDADYFAERWRRSGIGALHVAAWHNFEPAPEGDSYLRRLIEACHRKAILVYAWLELPHVSEKFWNDHPEWRERTAVLEDAQLDWRKLMNLQNRDCFRAVSRGVRELIGRFDWDGVNLSELYFESLEGAANPARLTPMNDDVRREFREQHGQDPGVLFDGSAQDAGTLRSFLDYRAELARRMQTEWIGQIESVRAGKRNLDLVLTHVDDRFDARMRDLLGADAGRVLPLLDDHDFTFLIEDPATIWHLGPQRYPQIASRYEPLTHAKNKLAIDINIVERYQDVYPTKQQTGIELFQLVHLASRAFPRVALYSENSILAPDLPLLPSAAATVTRIDKIGGKLVIESKYGVGISWTGPALVNGRPWPVRSDSTLWLPPGAVAIEPATSELAMRILDFNGDLQAATALSSGIELAYQSNSRAIAILDKRPTRVEIDGQEAPIEAAPTGSDIALMLPRGQHLVTISAAGRAALDRSDAAGLPAPYNRNLCRFPNRPRNSSPATSSECADCDRRSALSSRKALTRACSRLRPGWLKTAWSIPS